MKYAGFIPVEDASGARFLVFEYRVRRLLREVSVFHLDTGEPVSPDGAGNYVGTRTGETLCVVEEDLDVVPEAQGGWFEAILSR